MDEPIDRVIAQVDGPDRAILIIRFGRDRNGEVRSHAETAAELGITVADVRRAETKAVLAARMRDGRV